MTHIVLDAEATTDPAYGQRPEERTIEQRIASGVLLLDKPAGPTSHQVTAWVRDKFGLDSHCHWSVEGKPGGQMSAPVRRVGPTAAQPGLPHLSNS